ncbi:1002_t:CDS:2 [Entrophospora sp. SA101]|nr:1002_t:CDS:2 [Entrophospora sp. SA101]
MSAPFGNYSTPCWLTLVYFTNVKNTSSTTSTFSSNTFSIYFRTARNLSSIVEHLIKNEIESLQSFLEEKDRVQLSSEQTKIYDLVVHENSNVFFTGAAGTGKSLLLRVLIKALKQKHEKISYDKDSIGVTATTGIAAINIGGKTLHSFTGIGRCPDHYNVHGLVRKIDGSISASTRWNNVKVLIIDEIKYAGCPRGSLNRSCNFHFASTSSAGCIMLEVSTNSKSSSTSIVFSNIFTPS